MRRGLVYGKSDATGSAPVENPVHPTDLLATIYHSLGIKPDTIVYNHLNQPRELYQQLPLPEERSWEEFHAAFLKLHDASLVHDRR